MSGAVNVWAWADRFSKQIHRQAEISRLQKEINRTGTRCGDCDHWMKSRSCPKEKNISGQTRGPASNYPICGQFLETKNATLRRSALQIELAAKVNQL